VLIFFLSLKLFKNSESKKFFERLEKLKKVKILKNKFAQFEKTF